MTNFSDQTIFETSEFSKTQKVCNFRDIFCFACTFVSNVCAIDFFPNLRPTSTDKCLNYWFLCLCSNLSNFIHASIFICESDIAGKIQIVEWCFEVHFYFLLDPFLNEVFLLQNFKKLRAEHFCCTEECL